MKTESLMTKAPAAKTRDVYSRSLCNRTGLIVSFLFIGFFLLMKLLNLEKQIVFRNFNFVFLLGGILFVLSSYKKKRELTGIEYLKGIRMGLNTTFMSVVPFALFTGIYLKADESFMNFIKRTSAFGSCLNPGVLAGVVLIEGLVAGVLLTFIVMPYYKEK